MNIKRFSHPFLPLVFDSASARAILYIWLGLENGCVLPAFQQQQNSLNAERAKKLACNRRLIFKIEGVDYENQCWLREWGVSVGRRCWGLRVCKACLDKQSALPFQRWSSVETLLGPPFQQHQKRAVETFNSELEVRTGLPKTFVSHWTSSRGLLVIIVRSTAHGSWSRDVGLEVIQGIHYITNCDINILVIIAWLRYGCIYCMTYCMT